MPSHLDALTTGAPQLLITLAYDQSRMAGPPFSVDEGELRRLYSDRAPALLSSSELPGGLKGDISGDGVRLVAGPRPVT